MKIAIVSAPDGWTFEDILRIYAAPTEEELKEKMRNAGLRETEDGWFIGDSDNIEESGCDVDVKIVNEGEAL